MSFQLSLAPGPAARTAKNVPAGPGRVPNQHLIEENPMVRLHHCVSIACDQCGDGPAGPATSPHYPDEQAALDAVRGAGWLAAPDGRLLCPVCHPILACEADGHEFTDWQRPVSVTGGLTGVRCGCDPTGPTHRLGSELCGRVFRYCRRCALHESRTHTREVVA